MLMQGHPPYTPFFIPTRSSDSSYTSQLSCSDGPPGADEVSRFHDFSPSRARNEWTGNDLGLFFDWDAALSSLSQTDIHPKVAWQVFDIPDCDELLMPMVGSDNTVQPFAPEIAEENQVCYHQPPSVGRPVPQERRETWPLCQSEVLRHQQDGHEAADPGASVSARQILGLYEIEDHPLEGAKTASLDIFKDGIISKMFRADVLRYYELLVGVSDPRQLIFSWAQPPYPFLIFPHVVRGHSNCVLDYTFVKNPNEPVEIISQERWVPYASTQRKQKESLEMPVFFLVEDGTIGIGVQDAMRQSHNVRTATNQRLLGGKKTANIHIRLQGCKPLIHQIQVPDTVARLVKCLGNLVNQSSQKSEINISKDELKIIGLVHVGTGSWQLVLGHMKTLFAI